MAAIDSFVCLTYREQEHRAYLRREAEHAQRRADEAREAIRAFESRVTAARGEGRTLDLELSADS